MEIISFDIMGKFAHFRKFYSNSTALSFTIPPRTTIIGILANILGMGKDTYYEDFHSDNIRIGISVKSNMKKSFHRLNMLKITGLGDLRGKGGRTQIPFEVISGENIKNDYVIYRIFISPNKSEELYNNLKEKLNTNQQTFSISLGIANFTAFIKNIVVFGHTQIKEFSVFEQEVEFNSGVNSNNVLSLQMDNKFFSFVEEDLLPADFKKNFDREVVKMNRILFTIGNIPLKVKFTGKYYQINDEKQKQNIQFLE